MQVKHLMTSKVATVSPDHSVWHVAHILLKKGVSGLPVVDNDGALVGIITEGDLLRRSELGTAGLTLDGAGQPDDLARAYIKSRSWKVGDVMSSDVISVDESTTIQSAAALLGIHRIKRLPVLRRGRLAGILSRADLLKAVSRGGPDPEIRGEDAVLRALRARTEEAGSVLSRQPELAVEGGRVRVGGAMRSQAECDVVRMVVDSVVGSGFKDELTVEGA